MSPGLTFAIATRDELHLRGRLVERRLAHGFARHQGEAIEANDARDDELVARCDEAMESLRAASPPDARVRLVASARRVAGVTIASATMTIGRGGLFVVTDAGYAAEDAMLLAQPPVSTAHEIDYRAYPIAWHHGSAAVLLHEAVGHAAEHGHAPLAWPTWLSVQDEPAFAVDDLGRPARSANLLVEPPMCFRRESFRDVPLRRMTQLVARQERAPFELPDPRINIYLLAGGTYEALDETITLFVAAADLVEGGESRPLPPFTIVESRAAVARSLIGATGPAQRYPGVVCSSEGQELVVASRAPTMLTWFR